MTSVSASEKPDTRCLVEAAAWRKQLTEDNLESTPEFEVWLAAHVRHQAAWERVQAPWNFIGEQETSPELLELRRAALANAKKAAHRRWKFAPRRPARLMAIAVSTILTAAGLLAWYIYSPEVYRTQRGERRVVTLADGSQVQLDSSTELRVRYSTHARELVLSRGQARFDVAHDVERPFSVTAEGQKVVATGTAFNVDMLGASLLVTLIEGHVVVLPQVPADFRRPMQGSARAETVTPSSDERTSSQANSILAPTPGEPRGQSAPARRDDESVRTDRLKPAIELDAGQELIISASGSSNVIPANIERATAWQTGKLVFDNERLTAVIERVNRYSPEPIVLADPRAAELRISGVFKTGDVNGFVDTLTRYLPVEADRQSGSIRLSHR